MRTALAPALLALTALVAGAGCGGQIPSANSPAVQQEREPATRAAETLGADLLADRDIIAAGRNDVCRTGQRNQKVDESAFACIVSYGWVIPGAQTEAEVAGELSRMGDLLAGLGCEPIRAGGLADAQRYWSEGIQSDPGMLPSANFRCDESTVEVATLSPQSPRVAPLELQDVLNGDDVGTPDLQEYPADVEQRIADAGDAMSWNVTVGQVYARTE